MLVFSVEGSIGAGKTTFLRELESKGYYVFTEPVDEWTSTMVDGVSMLETFYNDKKKYGFSFQMYVLQSRVKHLMNALSTVPDDAVVIIERCPMTDKNIFAEMMYQSGIFSDYEYYVYNTWYSFLIDMVPPLNGLIYLQVEPGICVDRIMKRNRDGEELIDLHYIQTLNDKHNKWLINEAEKSVIPITVINGNGSIPDTSLVDDFVKRISEFETA